MYVFSFLCCYGASVMYALFCLYCCVCFVTASHFVLDSEDCFPTSFSYMSLSPVIRFSTSFNSTWQFVRWNAFPSSSRCIIKFMLQMCQNMSKHLGNLQSMEAMEAMEDKTSAALPHLLHETRPAWHCPQTRFQRIISLQQVSVGYLQPDLCIQHDLTKLIPSPRVTFRGFNILQCLQAARGKAMRDPSQLVLQDLRRQGSGTPEKVTCFRTNSLNLWT